MAPLPDNDKTPDKSDKNKQEKCKDKPKGSNKDEKTLSNLNDRELKALLDEAINYKNPKDREGKSELFNDLLLEAEETERIARATSAGGSELVRHCNPAARRQRHSGGLRGRRYGGPASSGLMGRSVSERGTHGGSLDNLAKEELYEATCRRLRGARKSSTSSSGASSNCGSNQIRVSARQREGGSLPCNVNAGDTSRDFLEDAKRARETRDKDYTVVDMETEGLLENDHLQRNYEERHIQAGSSQGGSSNQGETFAVTSVPGPKYTTNATLHIQSNCASNISNVDDLTPLKLESASDKKNMDSSIIAKVVPSKYPVNSPSYTKSRDDEKFFYFQKVDENGNALHQTKEKKKKKQADKNVVVLKSENIVGHKSEIINNVEQLVHYIEGTTENSLKSRSVQSSKSKQLSKHTSEDGGSRASKKKHSKMGGKENGNTASSGRHELKKSNSLGEISGMKLDREFEAFSNSGKNKEEDEDKVSLRNTKTVGDRTRERRSWGNVEAQSFQTFYNVSSLENLETSADNWVVTRPKKKSKKRRNSVSSASAPRQNSAASGVSSSTSNEDRKTRRAPSPDLGAIVIGVPTVKTTRSMPHSEKSNDSSSDVDSVHSLPMDGHISYADIVVAKNNEKKKPSPEKQERSSLTPKERSPLTTKHDDVNQLSSHVISSLEKTPNCSSSNNVNGSSINKNIVPDVHNIKSFPAITGTLTKSPPVISTAVSHHSGNITMTSDKAVQSTLIYEDSFIREKNQKPTSVGVALQTVPLETLQISGVVRCTLTSNGVTHSVPINSTLTLNTPVTNKRQSSPNSNIGKVKSNKEGARIVPVSKEAGGIQPNQAQGFFGGQNNIQNELPLMRDPAQYATQRMPPDIMDVSTIEKMQIMNYSSPHNVSLQSCTHQNSNQVSYTQTSCSMVQRDSSNSSHQGKSKRRKGGNTSKNDVSKEESDFSSVCDNLVEKEISSNSIFNGVSEEVFSSPEPNNQSNSPPPVVILSGHNKEVPSGLVFGFDINEQLLLEDTSGGGDTSSIVSTQNISENNIIENNTETSRSRAEEWIKRYKPLASEKNPPKHNHDKIVSYISSDWDSIVSQNVQYFSDDL